jgi:2,4-dienoyl-CoA reductase-like NADH-dependent reductase (Old Yellow Enzyme family)
MSNGTGTLFTPIAIGSLTINGRLIKTATAETRASEDGCVTEDLLAFYRPIALGGTPLIMNQFLTPYTNRRGDAYGGSLEGRSRLLCEAIRAIRARVGLDFPLIVKLNGSEDLPLRAGLKTSELVAVAAVLEREGIDAIEIPIGHYESGFPMVRGTFGRCLRNMVRGSMRHLPFFRRWVMRLTWPVLALAFNALWRGREGFNLRYAPPFKASLRVPVICVGGFRSRRAMEDALDRGLCDIVSAGRAFVADPLLYRHLRDASPGPVCVDATRAWAISERSRSIVITLGCGRRRTPCSRSSRCAQPALRCVEHGCQARTFKRLPRRAGAPAVRPAPRVPIAQRTGPARSCGFPRSRAALRPPAARLPAPEPASKAPRRESRRSSCGRNSRPIPPAAA